MNKWANYLISKEKWKKNTKTIDSFIVHLDNGEYVGEGIERNRNWVIQKLDAGSTFCCIHLCENEKWEKGSSVIKKSNGGLSWKDDLPLVITKRKSFISYYHKEDQDYKKKFKNLTSDLLVNKSVEGDDINSENKDEYIKQLIQNGYLNDTTVLIVLLGPKTKCRKHIDWEISGALNLKVGETYAGLLGLILPSHVDFGSDEYTLSELPQRLTDNLKTGYAVIRDYTTNRKKLQEYIELVFSNRSLKADKRINSRAQLQKNTCS
jgi:hypothetical protein